MIVNALVLPAQPGVMLFGGLALLVGMVALPLGQMVGWAAWLFLTWTLQVIHLFAQAPGVAIELGYVDPVWDVAYVAVLAALTFYVSRNAEQRAEVKQRMAKLLSPRLALPAIGVIVLLGELALSWQPDGKLHVHALAALGSRMPFWDRDIDVVVVTSDDAKSMNGLLAVVDRYQVEQIVSVDIGDNRAGREWLEPSISPDE